jgi:hypothetical protein
LVGERVQDNPVDGDTVAVRPTTPPNPLTAVTVIVEVAEPLTTMLAVVGLAVIVMSCPVYATVATCERLLLVASIVTV